MIGFPPVLPRERERERERETWRTETENPKNSALGTLPCTGGHLRRWGKTGLGKILASSCSSGGEKRIEFTCFPALLIALALFLCKNAVVLKNVKLIAQSPGQIALIQLQDRPLFLCIEVSIIHILIACVNY